MQKKHSDRFLDGLVDAIADIRQRLVEEGYFGRVVTEHESASAQPVTSVEFTVAITKWPQARETQPEAGEHDRDDAADIDMDR